MGMPTLIPRLGEARHAAAVAEFFSTAIFVFADQGSTMAIKKITDDGPVCVSGLPASVLAHAFSLSVAISAGANISGGRVNLAGTFGAFICGNITLLRSITYWIAQLLGSVVARVLLKPAAGNAFSISADVSRKSALVFEVVMTFRLGYTVYATAIEPRKSSVRVLAPLVIGCIMGANISVGGAFVGVSKNPALAFGAAVVSWNWADRWVYWVGPILVAALAALLFYTFFVIESSGDHLPQ